MEVHRHNIANCQRDEVLSPPPVGHRGVLVTLTQPQWEAGDLIQITIFGDQTLEVVKVTEIEPPAKCRREDLGDKGNGRFKTHWVEPKYDAT